MNKQNMNKENSNNTPDYTLLNQFTDELTPFVKQIHETLKKYNVKDGIGIEA